MEIIERIRQWLNMCESGTTIENIQDVISYTHSVMETAERATEFMRINQNARRVFREVRTALGSISDNIERVENICQTLLAVRRIRNAIQILNQNGIIACDPVRATRAFAELFQGLAQLASYLPPPANMYNPILEGLGGDFFENVSAGLDPNRRPRDQRAMRQIEEPNVRGVQR